MFQLSEDLNASLLLDYCQIKNRYGVDRDSPRRSMDRTQASGARNAGSIPAEGTRRLEATPARYF